MSLSPDDLDALEQEARQQLLIGSEQALALIRELREAKEERDQRIADHVIAKREAADNLSNFARAAYKRSDAEIRANQAEKDLTEARQEIVTLKLQAEALSEARMLADREAAECREKLDEGEGYCAALTESLEEQTKLLWSLGHCDTCHGTGKMQGFVGYRYDGEEITEECECGECHGASVRTDQQIQGTPPPEGSKAE